MVTNGLLGFRQLSDCRLQSNQFPINFRTDPQTIFFIERFTDLGSATVQRFSASPDIAPRLQQ